MNNFEEKHKLGKGVIAFVIDYGSNLLSVIIALLLIVGFFNKTATSDDMLSGLLAIVALLAVSLWIDRARKLTSISTSLAELIERTSSDGFTSENPLSQIDTSRLHRLVIIGQTLVGTQRLYIDKIKLILRETDVSVCIIMVNSASESAIDQLGMRMSVGKTNEYWTKTLWDVADGMIQELAPLLRQVSYFDQLVDNIEVRLVDYLPSFGLIIFNPDAEQSQCYLEIYPHKSVEKHYLKLTRESNRDWHDFFINQYTTLYTDSTKLNV